MNQPRLIPAELTHEVTQPEPPRPDMYVVIAYMRGAWYMPRFCERWYADFDAAFRVAERIGNDATCPFRHIKVVKIPGNGK